MIRKVISGGQTGVDIAALRAARTLGIATGGTAPRGFLTELGPNPELAGFGLVELPTPDYPARTAANVRDADATLIIAGNWDRGSRLTLDLCRTHKKPVCEVERGDLANEDAFDRVASWLASTPHEVLNIAGNRESTSPGIETEAEAFLRGVLALFVP